MKREVYNYSDKDVELLSTEQELRLNVGDYVLKEVDYIVDSDFEVICITHDDLISIVSQNKGFRSCLAGLPIDDYNIVDFGFELQHEGHDQAFYDFSFSNSNHYLTYGKNSGSLNLHLKCYGIVKSFDSIKKVHELQSLCFELNNN